jgi:type I restriction enzyme S subunit
MTSVPGLGEIDPRWEVKRAKWILDRQLRPVREKDAVVTAFRDGQVTLRSNRRLDGFTEAALEIGYHGVRVGDVAVHSMDAFAGAIGVSDSDGKVSPVVHLYKADEATDARYVAYVLRAMANSRYVQTLAKGIRERSTSFDAAVLANVAIPYPGLEEQRRIADFLDRVTAQIDDAVDLRRKQVALIDLRSRSRISTMADFLGARHGFIKLRYVLQKIEQGWSPQCEDRIADPGEWGVLKAGCVNGGVFDPSQHKALPASIEPELRYRIRPGDLLVSRASGSLDMIGSAGVVPAEAGDRLLLCDKVYRLRTDRRRMKADFVAPMLGTHRVRQNIRLGVSGAEGMANNLPTAAVVNLSIPDAPLDDQDRTVVEIAHRRSAETDAKILLARQSAVLVERRHALITAAVTGQIEVSTAAGVTV